MGQIRSMLAWVLVVACTMFVEKLANAHVEQISMLTRRLVVAHTVELSVHCNGIGIDIRITAVQKVYLSSVTY